MKILTTDKEIAAFLGLLRKRSVGVFPGIEETVRKILDDVKKRGDSAVKKYTLRFDKHGLPLRIAPAEIRKHAARADKRIVKALKFSAGRIRHFHERQAESSWAFRKDGALLGQMIRPLERVGIYVPGGRASYPSTVLMNVIPAQVAGVEEIALCVPTPNGEINPNVMAAIDFLGVKEVYRIGGAQAVGALAFGTQSIVRVDKITGPGNIFVALAKKMVFGEVDIDMMAGPSEILIIADKTADPSFVAADMLSQAEHDELASSILVTDSDDVAKAVVSELGRQLKGLKRKEIAAGSLKRFGAIIKTTNMRQATDLANKVAPEHLEIMTKDPEKELKWIKNAGAVFLGKWTPEPLGDYSAGPNHTLPTGGTARFSSPLGVYDFIKRTSILKFSPKGCMLLSDTVAALAEVEGLDAHAKTLAARSDFFKEEGEKNACNRSLK